MFTDTNVAQVKRGRVPPNVHLLPYSPLRRRQKTMLPSALVPASPYLGPRSNYAQSQGLNRKQAGLVCASAVIKRGVKKGINDLIEEERKGGNHTDSGSGGESMNGAPGTLLEQGIVGLLKCVKILVVLQSRWLLVVRIPSILLFVNPERLLLFLSIALLQKFMGGEEKKEKKNNTTKLKHWSSLLQINSLSVALSLALFLFLFPKVLTKSERMLCLKCWCASLGTLLFIPL